ncbi:hypothetical protein [Legionella fairfieldensis]|uniref:hypothetical protein n=1 Tax=Legionella fairfieldensis TaxID=45064 RepID=UPI00048DF345|nr:hypothetical protein [Legionella fairfieldensis]
MLLAKKNFFQLYQVCIQNQIPFTNKLEPVIEITEIKEINNLILYYCFRLAVIHATFQQVSHAGFPALGFSMNSLLIPYVTGNSSI